MSYKLLLKDEGDIDLTFTENHVVIAPVDGKAEEIRFGDIRKVHLTPVRRTSNWHFPPACIIITDNNKYKFTTRKGVYHTFTSMAESSNEDLDIMTGIAQDLHKVLVKKQLHNNINFKLGGTQHKAVIFIYPPFAIITVLQWKETSFFIESICIAVVLYALFLWMVKDSNYNPERMANEEEYTSFLLS
ncbi:MAG: hypothetical protein ABIK92_14225 [Pseudomonadota bacterium]